MMTIEIRHGNPSQTVLPQACFAGRKAEKGESVTNPSRTFVTDSKRGKANKYRGKKTLSPSLDKSVTYPPARRVCACVRTREGGVMDFRDGFPKEVCHASTL